MTFLPRLALPLVPLTLLGGTSPWSADSDLGFAPGRYTVLTKSFAEDTDLTVTSMEMLVNGGVIPEEELPDITIAMRRRLGLTDEYLGIADGRIEELHRTFDELSIECSAELEIDGISEEHTVTGESELLDATVSFTWNEAEEGHEVAFEEGDTGVAGHLEGLDVEADLRGFLPDGAVGEGDTWEVDPQVLSQLFTPGGDPWILPTEFGDERYVYMDLYAMVAAAITSLGDATDEFGGSVTATFKGVQEREDVTLGIVALEVEVTAEAERLERLLLAAENAGIEVEFDGLSYLWTLEGSGELAWNLQDGHFQSLELALDVDLDVDLVWTQTLSESELEFEGSYGLTGSTTLTARVETE